MFETSRHQFNPTGRKRIFIYIESEPCKDAKRPQTFEQQNYIVQEIRKALPKSKSEMEENSAGNVPLEARSAFISSVDMNWDNMFDPRLGLLSSTSSQFQQYLTCPVNIPFCNRSPCFNRYGQPPSSAGECYAQPGCCFDHNLYLYKLSFGNNFMEYTPGNCVQILVKK